jgi:hypothetical protein
MPEERTSHNLAPTATAAPCYNFSKSGVREKRTVIIAPITISNNGLSLKIGWACSSGPYCEDPNCRYSSKWRKNNDY